MQEKQVFLFPLIVLAHHEARRAGTFQAEIVRPIGFVYADVEGLFAVSLVGEEQNVLVDAVIEQIRSRRL